MLRIILGMLLASALSVIATGCSRADAELKDRMDIQSQARIKIPESAHNIRCATDAPHRGPDAATYGRFDIPAADLSFVLAKMPAGAQVKPYEGYSNVTSHHLNQSWWQPESLLNKRVADWSEPGYSFNLLIGESGEKGLLTVYFFNFSL